MMFFLILLVSQFSAQGVFAQNYTVPAGDNLQHFVDQSAPGDTLQLEQGVYSGNVELNKPRITLSGTEGTIIKGSGAGSVLTITGDSCSVLNLIITGSGVKLIDEDSGILLKSSGNTIIDIVLDDVLFGIYLYQSDNNHIGNNMISGKDVLKLSDKGNGIHMWYSTNNRITGNKITGIRDGIYFSFAQHNMIDENHVWNSRYGLHYMYSDNNEFHDNKFESSMAGAALMYSRNISFTRNTFAHNRGHKVFGVLFQSCEEVIAKNNRFADNTQGLFLDNAWRCMFTNNIFSENDVALYLCGSSGDNVLFDNSFLLNLEQLHADGRNMGNKFNYGQRGNYWDTYTGLDINSDGIGDTPYRMQNAYQYIESRYPESRFFFSSVASAAISEVENYFPLFTVHSPVDSFPAVRLVSGVRVMENNYRIGIGNLILCVIFMVNGTALLYLIRKRQNQ